MDTADPETGHGSMKIRPAAPPPKSSGGLKAFAFFSVGIITLLYCLAELAAALYIDSLALLSDGFHNLSDVISLYIAYWAQDAAKRDFTADMSYGWGRAEILGGLTNGCFLLSLSLYVALEAIPKFIYPKKMEAAMIFLYVAGAGLVVNTIGTLVFASVGLSHGHSHSHGHGHGGGDHGHDGHSHAKKNKNKHKDQQPLLQPGELINDHDEEEHGHAHKHKDKKKKKDHDHAHGAGHEHGHDHKHKDKKDKGEEHEHAHKHKDKKKKEGGGHGHSHGHGHKKDKQKKKSLFQRMDLNVGAVFLHYLGDTVSSLFVLGAGLCLHFLNGRAEWVALYTDPAISLLIVVLVVATTIPLVKRCSKILLQGVPSDIDLEDLRMELSNLDSVVSIHDLHIWQLVDGMIIASVHLMLEEGGSTMGDILYHVKRVFHRHGIHSSSIQPEFVKSRDSQDFCVQNCVEECEEDWCCKKTADRRRSIQEDYAAFKEI